MSFRSVIIYIIGFILSYIIAMISAMTASIPFIAAAWTLFAGYSIATIYYLRKYRVR